MPAFCHRGQHRDDSLSHASNSLLCESAARLKARRITDRDRIPGHAFLQGSFFGRAKDEGSTKREQAEKREQRQRTGRSREFAATSSAGGGGVTTSASWTSSPVGWTAMTGACLSCTTTGASAVLTGSATSAGNLVRGKEDGRMSRLGRSRPLSTSNRRIPGRNCCRDRTTRAGLPAVRPVFR